MNLKKNSLTLLLLFLLIGAFVALSDVNTAHAASGDNVSGWAWSENIGWLSFNNVSAGTQLSYGVKIDDSIDPNTGVIRGTMSGYAWSENIGWVSFNGSDTTGCPVAPCQAKVVGNALEGWARALNGVGRTDGYDGWISLKGSNYGITLNTTDPATTKLENYAWGSDVIGWVQFSGVTTGGTPYGVVWNKTPATPDTGSVRIKRVDANLNDTSVGSYAKLDTQSLVANPVTFTGVTVGSHSAGVGDVASTTIRASICTYPQTGTECSMTSSSTYTIVPTITAGVATVPVTVTKDTVTKIVFRYVPVTSDPAATSVCQAQNLSGVQIFNEYVGVPINWVVVNPPAGATYDWDGSVDQNTTVPKVTTVYTTTGLKTESVKINGGSAIHCDLPAFRIFVKPVFIEF
jgi:hypothetical protein